MSKFKKVWNDSVFSKVIAQVIIWAGGAIAVIIWGWIKSAFDKISFGDALSSVGQRIKDFFYYDTHLNILSVALIIAGYIVLSILLSWFIKWRRNRSFRSFTQAKFNGAIVKWKWEKKKGEWKIKYDDYEFICPKCQNNMQLKYDSGNHFLKCLICSFTTQSHYYEAPSGAVILADMDTYHFHLKLESLVLAEIRKRGLK